MDPVLVQLKAGKFKIASGLVTEAFVRDCIDPLLIRECKIHNCRLGGKGGEALADKLRQGTTKLTLTLHEDYREYEHFWTHLLGDNDELTTLVVLGNLKMNKTMSDALSTATRLASITIRRATVPYNRRKLANMWNALQEKHYRHLMNAIVTKDLKHLDVTWMHCQFHPVTEPLLDFLNHGGGLESFAFCAPKLHIQHDGNNLVEALRKHHSHSLQQLTLFNFSLSNSNEQMLRDGVSFPNLTTIKLD